MSIENIFGAIAENSAAVSAPAEGDYTENGLLYCGKCHTPKQAMIRQPRLNGFGQGERPLPVLCACRERALDEERRTRRLHEIRQYRETVLGKAGADRTFDKDDGKEQYASRVCRGYAGKFSLETTDGLLLCGGAGTGKSFLAYCILNAVADKGHSVMFTTVSQLERSLWKGDKAEIFDRIEHIGLLVLDDLGSERQSDYMQQIVFDVLDCRLNSRRPVIITTNLTRDELISPVSPYAQRIMSRVHGSTLLVIMKGVDRRKKQFVLSSEERLADYYNAGEAVIMNNE